MTQSGQIECDKKGRIYLKEEVRDRYGRKFYLIEGLNEVILLPIPQDPLKDLQELGKNLPDISIKEMRRRAQEKGRREALNGLRRH